MSLRLAIALLAAVPVSASAAPDFVPRPSQAYEGFMALNPPRAEVPIGSLWIDGYGPTGESASASNLETVRSLNGMTIDRNLQLNLSAGLFELIGIDPRFRDHYIARFTDLSIVRVKDVGQLPGAKGEPRIVEALKAASVTVSTEGEIGLNARTTGFEMNYVSGNGTSGRTRKKMIEGRNLFIAVRVATLEFVEGKERKIDLSTTSSGDVIADVDDYRISLRQDCSPSVEETASECHAITAGIVKLSTQPASAPVVFEPFDDQGVISLKLPVPTADGQGGLYDGMILELADKCPVLIKSKCRSVRAHYIGQRLEDQPRINAKGW